MCCVVPPTPMVVIEPWASAHAKESFATVVIQILAIVLKQLLLYLKMVSLASVPTSVNPALGR